MQNYNTMRKRVLLFICSIGMSVSTFAQVKIGHNAQGPINDAALLELSNNSSGTPATWKTLLLPYVDFTDNIFANSATWGIAGSPTDGAVVYNTGARRSDGFSGKGVYVWSNGAWTLVQGSAGGCADPDATHGATGCVTFNYRGQQVSYTTVRAKDDKIWLQQNLGSSRVATFGGDAAAFGDYFQWGRWDDGHQSKFSPLNSVLPSPNDPSGLGMGAPVFFGGTYPWWWGDGDGNSTWSGNTPTATNGKDPCSALGIGWRMPSQADWQNLFLAENITDTTSGFNSNIKLAKAGYRLDGGTFALVSEYANCWTSTPSNPAPPTGMGMAINVTESTANTSNMYPRALGMPCRCVKD